MNRVLDTSVRACPCVRALFFSRMVYRKYEGIENEPVLYFCSYQYKEHHRYSLYVYDMRWPGIVSATPGTASWPSTTERTKRLYSEVQQVHDRRRNFKSTSCKQCSKIKELNEFNVWKWTGCIAINTDYSETRNSGTLIMRQWMLLKFWSLATFNINMKHPSQAQADLLFDFYHGSIVLSTAVFNN